MHSVSSTMSLRTAISRNGLPSVTTLTVMFLFLNLFVDKTICMINGPLYLRQTYSQRFNLWRGQCCVKFKPLRRYYMEFSQPTYCCKMIIRIFVFLYRFFLSTFFGDLCVAFSDSLLHSKLLLSFFLSFFPLFIPFFLSIILSSA